MGNRVGFGYDVHRLEEGEELIIGGVVIEYHKGTVAHSDGDVLVHAICDALLGAAGLRDIGYHFPDNDESLKKIDSMILLERSVQLLKDKGFSIINIDTTICLQKPRIQEMIPTMIANLARVLSIDASNISVKATTTEYLGFVGRGDGMTSFAVALVESP